MVCRRSSRQHKVSFSAIELPDRPKTLPKWKPCSWLETSVTYFNLFSRFVCNLDYSIPHTSACLLLRLYIQQHSNNGATAPLAPCPWFLIWLKTVEHADTSFTVKPENLGRNRNSERYILIGHNFKSGTHLKNDFIFNCFAHLEF